MSKFAKENFCEKIIKTAQSKKGIFKNPLTFYSKYDIVRMVCCVFSSDKFDYTIELL